MSVIARPYASATRRATEKAVTGRGKSYFLKNGIIPAGICLWRRNPAMGSECPLHQAMVMFGVAK
ncbi:MAG: hypothetical protein HN377_07755 [Alphaproteobacteria bacterium]|nr:hypothetical protein [Alphaproteobacteria bacterium]